MHNTILLYLMLSLLPLTASAQFLYHYQGVGVNTRFWKQSDEKY